METIIFKTLMHSVWQGLVLAVITAAVIIFTKRSSSALRYKCLTACLFLFTTGTIITLVATIRDVNVKQANLLTTIGQPVNNVTNVIQNNKIHKVSGNPVYDNFISLLGYLNQHAAYIVWFWMLIIFVKSIQMALGLQKISYLKRNELHSAGNYWEEQLKVLCAKFNIHQKVRIMQSGIAKAPLVAGHFKPLILIPLGLMNNLTTAEVEAIISHELAHIKRKDYLVNLLQSFLGIIFFFNPAVLWLNRLIREERENCCDDLSLTVNVSLRDYISALVSCTELAQGGERYALGFAAQKSQLMNRVNRMIYKKNSSINTFQKVILVALLFSIQLLTAAVSMPAAINMRQTKQEKPAAKPKTGKAVTDTSKVKVKIKTVTNRTETTSSLTVTENDQKVSDKSKITDRKDASPEQISIKDAYDRDRAEYIEQHKASVVAHEASAVVHKASVEVRDMYNQDKMAQLAEQKRNVKELLKKTDDLNRTRQNELETQLENIIIAEKEEKKSRNADIDIKPYEGSYGKRTGQQYKIYPGYDQKKERRFTEEDGKKLHNELYNEGIIKDKNNTSYILNSKELKIDGVKQPEALRKKYADKYLYRPDMSILYNYDYNSSTYKTP